jgi:hypothetical protein
VIGGPCVTPVRDPDPHRENKQSLATRNYGGKTIVSFSDKSKLARLFSYIFPSSRVGVLNNILSGRFFFDIVASRIVAIPGRSGRSFLLI